MSLRSRRLPPRSRPWAHTRRHSPTPGSRARGSASSASSCSRALSSSHDRVIDYRPEKARALSDCIERLPRLVFEAALDRLPEARLTRGARARSLRDPPRWGRRLPSRCARPCGRSMRSSVSGTGNRKARACARRSWKSCAPTPPPSAPEYLSRHGTLARTSARVQPERSHPLLLAAAAGRRRDAATHRRVRLRIPAARAPEPIPAGRLRRGARGRHLTEPPEPPHSPRAQGAGAVLARLPPE